jgi:hypothetical protein
MSKNIYHLSLDLNDISVKKYRLKHNYKWQKSNTYENKNPSFKSYHHTTNLEIWSYIDGELVLTPFDKEVLNVEKNYN